MQKLDDYKFKLKESLYICAMSNGCIGINEETKLKHNLVYFATVKSLDHYNTRLEFIAEYSNEYKRARNAPHGVIITEMTKHFRVAYKNEQRLCFKESENALAG